MGKPQHSRLDTNRNQKLASTAESFFGRENGVQNAEPPWRMEAPSWPPGAVATSPDAGQAPQARTQKRSGTEFAGATATRLPNESAGPLQRLPPESPVGRATVPRGRAVPYPEAAAAARADAPGAAPTATMRATAMDKELEHALAQQALAESR